MIIHICAGCGAYVERKNEKIGSPKCFNCKQKRRSLASANHYNLKRRKHGNK